MMEWLIISCRHGWSTNIRNKFISMAPSFPAYMQGRGVYLELKAMIIESLYLGGELVLHQE